MASPDIVRVGAVPGVFVQAPGRGGRNGAQVEYLGRRTDHDAIKVNSVHRVDGVVALKNLEACYPPDNGHNSEYRRVDGPSVMNAVRTEIRTGNAVPLDETTAAWAGVPFRAPTTELTAPEVAPATSPAPRVPRRSTSDAKDS